MLILNVIILLIAQKSNYARYLYM